MTSDAERWTPGRLGDIIDVNPKRQIERGTKAPFVAMADVIENRRSASAGEVREFKGSGARFGPGDVLLARITPCLENGKAARVDFLADGEAGHGSTEFIVLAGKPGAGDTLFAYYLARDPRFRAYAIAHMSGTSGRQRVSPASVAGYEMSLPSLEAQRRIARILGSLDDKVESNRRVAGLLAEIAATQYSAAFVDLVDRVDLVESEVGPIPPGWAVRELGEIAADQREAVDPQAEPELEYEHFSFPAFDAGRSPDFARGAELKSAKLKVTSDCVLLAKLNPKWQRVWWPRPSGRGTPVCSPEFVVLCPRPGVPHAFLYATARFNPRLRSHILSHATGTTGSRQRVRPGEILKARIAVPPEGELAELSQPLATLFAGEEAALEESRALAAIRDTLLPHLISGQIGVPSAEAVGAEA